MANGQCDICGRPATARVRASINGKTQDMELCDQHYREMVRRSGRSASPLESLPDAGPLCGRDGYRWRRRG